MIEYRVDREGILIELSPVEGIMINTRTSSFYGYKVIDPGVFKKCLLMNIHQCHTIMLKRF